MNLYEKLSNVQNALKAPKSQFNKFGNYNYRNCEDIVEAAKPLLKANGLTLTMHDEIVMIGNRYYVKATARITEIEEKELPDVGVMHNHSVSVTAYAREEESKKGMDGSQVTGASSSYARKYALNGLFCIDDTKDSDTTNTGNVVKMESLDDAKSYVLDFGEHKGKTLSEVYKTDRGYLEWLYCKGDTDPVIRMGIGILVDAVKNRKKS